MPWPARSLALIPFLLAVPACAGAGDGDVRIGSGAETTTLPTTILPATTLPTTTRPPTTLPTTTVPPVPTTVPPAGAAAVVYHEQDHTPMTTVGPVTLHHPAARVEFIGFHQAGHDGSQGQDVLDGAAPSTVLDDRGRNTDRTGAADVVVDPTVEIRSPVTGTVIRAGGYVLYCDHEDHFVVIEPDAAPGWEVKVFHMETIHVDVGDRVEAGLTPLSPNSRRLPFESQVDAFTAEPSNPHVHIEVVDPSIPDIPSGSGGSC